MRRIAERCTDITPIHDIPNYLLEKIKKGHTETMSGSIECSFCNATAKYVGRTSRDPSGYCFMCEPCMRSDGHYKIYPFFDVLNRYDRFELKQILSSLHYLPNYGCVVWLDDNKLWYCEANSFFEKGFTDAGTVDCVEEQDFLDAVNSHFGTNFTFDDFPGR